MPFEVDGFLQATDEFNKLARKQENKIELTLHPQKEENTEKLLESDTSEIKEDEQPTTKRKNTRIKSLTDSDYKPDVIPEYNIPKGK